jgi:large subunit ribosomal protein L9
VKISVILSENVPELGKRGEEIQVRRGFARNYLIPSKKAVYNTETNKALFDKEKIIAGQGDGNQLLDSTTQKVIFLSFVSCVFEVDRECLDCRCRFTVCGDN